MRILILIILTGFLLPSYGQEKVGFETHVPNRSSIELVHNLDSAYTQQDSLKIIDFFNQWNQDIKPNEAKFVNQNKSVESVYEIYKAFYIPTTPFKLGDWEKYNIPKISYEYFVIQNKVLYCILPSNDFDKFDSDINRIDTIHNFKPRLDDLGQHRILYLTPEYENALNQFLGLKYRKLGTGNIMTPSLPEGESSIRYYFLKKYIHIIHGHWGGYCYLATHPEVSRIVINKDLDKAKIYFRYGYEGGSAELEKHDGKWTIISSKATWIE